MNDLTHIDLFSGIGGFALAAGWAGFRTIAFCEIESFCQEVLKARFGVVADTERRVRKQQAGAVGRTKRRASSSGDAQGDDFRPLLIPDIFTLDGTRFRGATLLTGGFPCQPFSHAGKRRGKEDDRAIWPQMLRVIHEARPAWVIGENVSGLISMELDQVLADLEMEGYATRTFHIGAVGVNAPHRRMRVWIVANRPSLRCESGERMDTRERMGQKQKRPHPAAINSHDAPSQNSLLSGDGGRGDGDSPRLRWALQTARPDSDAPDAAITGLPHRRGSSLGEPREEQELKRCGGNGPTPEQWDIPWIEVATSFCRVDDGLPAWIHAHRVARLKALGNAIVPQVAHEIIRVIAQIERGET